MSSREPSEKNVSPWFSIKKAREFQFEASKRIIRRNSLPRKIEYVAGVDTAYIRKTSICAVAVIDYNSFSLVEYRTVRIETKFPYIPTLLSFREICPSVAAVRKLRLQPDVFLVDGQGIMHPYRLGFASHLGLVLGRPTIGVAKSPLIGQVGQFNEENWAPISDKKEVVGAAVLTKKETKPVYVSVGHMVSLKKAIEIVKHCSLKHRVPEPIHLAHGIATEEKQKIKTISWQK